MIAVAAIETFSAIAPESTIVYVFQADIKPWSAIVYAVAVVFLHTK
jgi:hypothetical protein